MSKRSDGPRSKVCVICDKTYERGNKRSNASWNNSRTCSVRCRAELQKISSGSKSPRFCQQCRVTTLKWYQSVFCSQSCREIWNDEHEQHEVPPILQEWPEWMAIERPFAAHDCDPSDGHVVRLRGPDPHRTGFSLYGSSADWTMSYGRKSGPWERGYKK